MKILNKHKNIDCIIIGAGVIGLAIARTLAPSMRVIILESQSEIGQGASFRNSAVLHAGIYYTPGSLKARFCVEGQSLLYAYCERNQIPHKKIGKLIVATNESQVSKLIELKRNAEQNGVCNLEMLTPAAVQAIEPAVKCSAALFSPGTGIISGVELLHSFKREVESAGSRIILEAEVDKIKYNNKEFTVSTKLQNEIFTSRFLINAAGLYATDVARSIDSIIPSSIPTQYFAKGNYFRLSALNPFSHLIYPMPESGGLGVHATPTLRGELLLGPDVEWIQEINYDVDAGRMPFFYDAIEYYHPSIRKHSIVPAFAGVRSKLSSEGMLARDFMIQGHDEHGVPGLINLFGIESPGLTASLAIANYVKTIVGEVK